MSARASNVATRAAAAWRIGDQEMLRSLDEEHRAQMVNDDELVTLYDDGSVLLVFSDIGTPEVAEPIVFDSLKEYQEEYERK